jgi:hypothetical protein
MLIQSMLIVSRTVQDQGLEQEIGERLKVTVNSIRHSAPGSMLLGVVTASSYSSSEKLKV